MALKDPILAELTHEAKSTRKMLERSPAESFGWKPHQKSKTLGELASHVAGLTDWLPRIVNSDEFNFATANFQPKVPATSKELMEHFEESLSKAQQAMGAATDEILMGKWKLRNGEMILFDMPRINAIRSVVLNHIVHHRAQLSVYLRLLDVPVPGMYGPTADEGIM